MTSISVPQPDDAGLGEFMQMATRLFDADTRAETALAEVGEQLNVLWGQAEAAGDDTAKTAITVTWQRAEANRQLVQQQDAALTAASSVMRELLQQRRQALQELTSLAQAIENVDTLDPRLADFVRGVEEETILYMEEAMYDDAMGQAMDAQYDNLFEEFRTNVSQSTGVHWLDLKQFMEWVTGHRGELNSVQIGLFRAFISALNAVIPEEEAARV